VSHSVRIGKMTIGAEGPLCLIAGPCVIENDEMPLAIAKHVRDICSSHGIQYIFKSSYDKANRTSVSSFRGPGVDKGLAIIAQVKEELEVPVLVDVHKYDEIERAAAVADILQIPAFLCRQTDFVQDVARTGLPVNIKKGQFLTPWDISWVVEKVEAMGNQSILLTERGTCFGYSNLVVDFRSFPVMAETGYPVIFDVTHSVQLPAGKEHETRGQPQFIAPLARAAVAAGVNGLFMEVHPDPAAALCDSGSMFPLDQLDSLLGDLCAIKACLAKRGVK